MPQSETFTSVLDRFLSRRAFLATTGAAFASLAAARGSALPCGEEEFEPVEPVAAQPPMQGLTVSAQHTAQVLLRWGDPLTPNAPAFDPHRQSAAAQQQQFGYNCDFVGYFPLAGEQQRGLLVVNHEYNNPELMFPAYDASAPTGNQVAVEQEAVGLSVVEIEFVPAAGWRVVLDSPRNRRITATTPMTISGPAADHPWVGTSCQGTMNNCSAGKTPWGTVLSGEENFQDAFAFAGELPDGDRRRTIHLDQIGLARAKPGYDAGWYRYDERFDVRKHPNEPFKFGWVVEVDPFAPDSTPRKRTALGRMKHEACTFAQGRQGQAVLYTGDDEKFQCVYKFVSRNPYVSGSRDDSLLDDGTLYVARFNDDGTGEWLPLVFGQGPLSEANGFASQAEVLIETRRAARLLGGTLMDRPEDIETNPETGKVYVVLTNNSDRGKPGKPSPDAANPRPNNRFGHLLELTESGGDAASTRFEWSVFLLAGPPEHKTIANPDNICFDARGALWIATDGAPASIQTNDGLFKVPVAGSTRGVPRQFLSAPSGSEVCGPEFTPDGRSLFVALQHPGEGSRTQPSTFEKPLSRWPDNDPALPPRPSVVVIRRDDGGPIR